MLPICSTCSLKNSTSYKNNLDALRKKVKQYEVIWSYESRLDKLCGIIRVPFSVDVTQKYFYKETSLDTGETIDDSAQTAVIMTVHKGFKLKHTFHLNKICISCKNRNDTIVNNHLLCKTCYSDGVRICRACCKHFKPFKPTWWYCSWKCKTDNTKSSPSE